MKLHETTELKKEDAVKGGSKNSYYHPDCWHTMQTVNEIRDLFVKRIDPTLTGKQIGMLVSTINNIVFAKHIDVDYLKFTVEYFINNKPGALKYPAGLHYVIQDRDVKAAWEREQRRKIKEQMREAVDQLGEVLSENVTLDFGVENSKYTYNQKNKSRFSSVLGV